MDMSKALEMMQHAVGYPKFYRNHYCLEPECKDTQVWDALVTMKLARSSMRQSSWTGGMITYSVTPAGIEFLKQLRREERKAKRDAKALRAAEVTEVEPGCAAEVTNG